jgi:DNA polymerase-1
VSKLIVDIETDGLLDTLTTMWCMVTRDVQTDEVKVYLKGDLSWQQDLNQEGNVLIAHNGLGFDFPALKKLFGWEPTVKIHDTMLMSQVLNYMRFNGKHSLAAWGEFLSCPKGEFSEFSKFSEEMLEYCKQDTLVNVKIYKWLMAEYKEQVARKPLLQKSLQNEHATAKFCADAELAGWEFDLPKAKIIKAEMEAQMKIAEDKLNPKLRRKFKGIDVKEGLDAGKECKWIKSGDYAKATCDWFGVHPSEGKTTRPILGSYCRVEQLEPDIGSMESVKEYLYSIGWVPDDWNWKKIGREFIKGSPKLTTSSLEKLGEDGLLLDEYYTTRSRHSILEGWISNLDSNGRLHGSCFTISTPTGRARHSGIVNVPGADAPWGKGIRELFIAKPGYKVVGADSSGNQFRALCHYLKNDDYTNTVLNGRNEDGTDVHSVNARLLTEIIGEEVSRKTAKPFIYAFLFGGGGEKLGLILTGKRDRKIGQKAKDEFIRKVPGLYELTRKIQEIYHKTEAQGNAWIPAADGRRIFCDSPHKALNYLLQSFEAISCKAAVAYAMEKFKERNLDVTPLIWYHDEFEVECPESQVEEVRDIMVEAFREAGKDFGMMILDGEGKIGDNWYDVH